MNDPVNDLLSEYERRRGNGESVTPEELCRSCPEHLPDLKRQLAALDRVPSEIPSPVEAVYTLPKTITVGVDYEVLSHHAQGGLGEVLLARDPSLGREVAVKRIRPPLDTDPARHSRFLHEAKITGGLEHPGIVPVYGLGRDDSGRPCYAMRFVRGETLLDALRGFHARPFDSVAFRDLLGRFAGVCQAVAYAHSRDIIHRDIKPANIVLGSFGEAILLDWGLAKDLHATTDMVCDSDALPTDRFDNQTPRPHATATGAVLGTPAYMAPEQHEGHPVGPAADIYGLGATLHHLLTNRLPSDHAPPVRPVPAPLLAIARKAMDPESPKRYATATALAEDVARWLADEPISAYRDPPSQRLARWGRRNRPLVRTGIAALVLGIIGLAIAAGLLKQAGDRERAAAELANRRKTEADENYRRAHQAVDDLFVAVADGKLKTLPGTQPIRKDLLRLALKYYRDFLAERGSDPASREGIAATSTKVAMIIAEVESAGASLEWHEKAISVWRELLNASPERAEYRKELAGALDLYGLQLSKVNRLDDAIAVQKEAVILLESLYAGDPDNVAVGGYLSRSLVNLAVSQGSRGLNADAIRTGERGLAVDTELARKLAVARRELDSYILRVNMVSKYTNLGLDFADLGRMDDAIRNLETACRIGVEVSQEWEQLREKPAATGHSLANPRAKLVLAQLNLAVTLNVSDRPADALALLSEVLKSGRAIAAENPTVRLYREIVVTAEINFVHAGLVVGKPARELLPESERACETSLQLESDDPTNPSFKVRRGLAHAARSTVKARMGNVPESADDWKTALGCFPAGKGSNAIIGQLLGNAWQLRALALLDLNDLPGAATAVQNMLETNPGYVWTNLVAARLLARCSRRAPESEKPNYADRAMAALKQAIQTGQVKVERLGNDPDLEPFRTRADFQAIVGKSAK